MSDVTEYMDVEFLGPSMPVPIPGFPDMQDVTVLPDAGNYIEVGPFIEPEPEPKLKKFIHNHPPGQYCYFCACAECRYFYGTGRPVSLTTPKKVIRPPPRYSYIDFVNSMRAAAARREEARQEKLQAEREKAAAALAPKADKGLKDQAKKNHKRACGCMKRRQK